MVTLPFKMGSLQWVSLFYHLLLSLSIVSLGAIALGESEPWLLLLQAMPDLLAVMMVCLMVGSAMCSQRKRIPIVRAGRFILPGWWCNRCLLNLLS
ncbi:MAG: hypothetical protein AUH89_02790 [Ktedonobacter sp. 13_1_40CM_4_52_4]|nr:MAG: hypothetical protein AUH89_02790 [Ktedonobacter sp. 13_1_40CM_4_52_4]